MFKKKSMLGIDICAGYINVVKKNGRGHLIKWMAEPVPEQLIKQGLVKSERDLALFIRQKLKEYKIRGKKCGVCFSSDQVIVRELYFPAMLKDTLIDNIRYEISEYLPLSIDNYVIDYRILNNISYEKNIVRVMAVAAPKNIVNSYIRILKKAGLKPVIIDIPANCQEIWYNEYISNLEGVTDKNVCLIYTETFSTRFTLLHEGIYYIDKISSTIINDDNEINMELLIEEIQQILDFYYARNTGHEINKIVLIVDKNHSNISVEQIEQYTGIPVYLAKKPIDAHNRICLPNAIGIAIEQEKRRDKRINLIKSQKEDKIRIRRLLIMLISALLAIGVVIKGFWIPICNKYKVIDEIKTLEVEKNNYVDIFYDYQVIKNEIEFLNEKKQLLDRVTSDQKQLSYLFEIINNCLPSKVIIIEFSTDNSSIKLTGRADSDDTIVQFLIALANTGEFNQVFINEIALEQDTGLKLFRLQCNINIYSNNMN